MSRKLQLAAALLVSMGSVLALLLVISLRRVPDSPPHPEEFAREASPAPPTGDDEKKAASPDPENTAPAPPATKGWVVRGRVLQEGEPASGVHIRLRSQHDLPGSATARFGSTAVTGPDGLFGFIEVPGDKELRLELDAPTYAPRAFDFELREPPAGEARLELGDLELERASTLTVKLVGPHGEPVEKGRVMATRAFSSEDERPWRMGLRDTSLEVSERGGGEYVLERGPDGALFVSASAPGYAYEHYRNEPVELPRQSPLTFRLEEAGRIAGTVKDGRGRQVEGAEVNAYGKSYNPGRKTDASGAFLFDSLLPGTYEIGVSADGLASTMRTGVATGTLELAFSLSPEAVVAGQVVREDNGQPVERATVHLSIQSGGNPGVSGFNRQTAKDGLFEFKRLAAGTYTLSTEHAELLPTGDDSKLEVHEGERTAGYTLRMKDGITITGKVVDSRTGKPLPGTRITFHFFSEARKRGMLTSADAKSTETGADGAFKLKGLAEGVHQISLETDGYFRKNDEKVTLEPDGEREFTFELVRGGTIAGRVLDVVGSPIPDAHVSCSALRNSMEDVFWDMSDTSPRPGREKTDAEGSFLIVGVPANPNYMVTARHKEHAQGFVSGVAIEEGEDVAGIEIRLAQGGSIRGRVLDSEGRPVPKASLYASEQHASSAHEGGAATDDEGRFVIGHLTPGIYSVRAGSQGLASSSREGLAVVEGKTTECGDITLGAGNSISGRVVDAGGRPIVGAEVKAVGHGSTRAYTVASARSDAAGVFHLHGFEENQFLLQASSSGYETSGLEILLPLEPGAGGVVLALKRSAVIAGRVRAGGALLRREFRVFAIKSPALGLLDLHKVRTVNGEGAFELPVGAGTYRVQVQSPGFAPALSEEVTVRAGERREGMIIDIVPQGTIRGVVVMRGSREPVEDASVTFRPAQGRFLEFDTDRTAFDGTFVLEGVPPGTVQLVVGGERGRYPSVSIPGIAIRSGEEKQVRVEVSPGGGVHGVLTREGRPLSKVRVHASARVGSEEIHGDAESDDRGRFEILGLPAGEYMLSGWDPLGFPERWSVGIPELGLTEAIVDLHAGTALTGRVTAGGAPLAGARTQVRAPSRRWWGQSDDVGPDGEYHLAVPGAGSYRLSIRWDEGSTGVELAVPDGVREYRKDIELPSGNIRGVVVDAETGAPVPEARLSAFTGWSGLRSFYLQEDAERASCQTDKEGRFVLTHLPPGLYRLRVHEVAHAEGWSGEVRVSAGGGGTADLRIALERGVAFQVKVEDPSGRPISGASVRLLDREGNLVQFILSEVRYDEGILELSHVRPGPYQLVADHRDFAPAAANVQAAEGALVVARLARGGRLTVRVADAAGRPVEGALVQVLDESGQDLLDDTNHLYADYRTTDTAGLAFLSRVPAGHHRAVARKGALPSAEERFSLAADGEAEVRLVLRS